MNRDEIKAAALTLPADERYALAWELLEDPEFAADVSPSWSDEINRRVAEIDAGQVEMIPAEQVFEGLRARSAELRMRRAG